MKSSEISALDYQGLKGRLWRAPAKAPEKNKNIILLIYGHHASLERNAGLVAYLQNFGQVVAPDLPGFGGMDAFYKLGQKPKLEAYAQYLHNFIEEHLPPQQSFSLVSMSFGFLVVTRMLQKYPQHAKNIKLLISLAGFVSSKALKFKPLRLKLYRFLALIIQWQAIAFIYRYLLLNSFILRRFYAHTYLARSKFAHKKSLEKKKLLEMEIKLWQCNDVRTWAATASMMLTIDIKDPLINITLHQAKPQGDQYFEAQINDAQLRSVFKKLVFYEVDFKTHAPTVIAQASEVEAFIPEKLHQELAQTAQTLV